MARRLLVLLLAVAGLGSVGCRPDTVRLGFAPEVGDTYRYRYVVEATITRQVDGEEPRTTDVRLTIESTQTVVEPRPDGTVVDVTLDAPEATPRTVTVVMDRAGSLQAIEQVDGLPADAAGLPAATLLGLPSAEPPDAALSIGETWSLDDGPVEGEGRLDRLGVLDGEPAAVVEATLREALQATEARSGSEVALDGTLRADGTTAFDVGDGAIRRSETRSHGRVDVEVAPPEGVTAAPVRAVVTYELRVTTTRLDE